MCCLHSWAVCLCVNWNPLTSYFVSLVLVLSEECFSQLWEDQVDGKGLGRRFWRGNKNEFKFLFKTFKIKRKAIMLPTLSVLDTGAVFGR